MYVVVAILQTGVNVCGPQIPLDSVCKVDLLLLLEGMWEEVVRRLKLREKPHPHIQKL